ncbi:MAG: DnaJ domain-containing protein [Rhodoferax sp.]|nr:DnaJ domain-containing protein [Rhodoferax sp.]
MDLTHAFSELGLALHATPAQAKTAYRTLAKRWHPDVNRSPDADTRMKHINVAYAAVIAHLTLRERVAAGPQPSPATPQRPAAAAARRGAARSSGFAEFDWRAGFTRVDGRQGQPTQRTLQLSLLEAAFGCVKRIRGSASDGWTLLVRIHPGTCDGAVIAPQDIRICASVQALPQTITLSVRIVKHPLFQLEQDRLSVHVPISIWRWVLGGEITVPTLDGLARVHLPPRASAVQLQNQGWPRFQQARQRLPLWVVPQRVYPAGLGDGDRRLLQALDAAARLPEVEGWKRSLQDWAESGATQAPA